MANIIPLRGIRYAGSKVGCLDHVIAPPYDVISPEEQDRLYSQSPYNIIRLEKPRPEPGNGTGRGGDGNSDGDGTLEGAAGDGQGDETYMRARDHFLGWLQDGVLQTETKPVLYLYEQIFGINGERKRRQGITCGVKLVPYEEKVVLPHEETMAKPKEDRLKLLRACRANFSPIFGLYAAKDDPLPSLMSACRKTIPVMDFEDSKGQGHRIWTVEDPGVIQEVARHFEDKQIFIADGHHRYETALAYHEELGRPAGPAGYIMMNLVNIFDPGLIVLPTHRMVRARDSFDFDPFLASLEEGFGVQHYPYGSREVCGQGLQLLEKAGKEGPAFGLFAGEKKFFILRHKAYGRQGEKSVLLDAVVLQEEILERKLGIDAQKLSLGGFLGYTRDCEEAVSEVLEGRSRLSFLLNPTPPEAVMAAAAAGQKMPQKSTYFYPKLAAGLIINPLS